MSWWDDHDAVNGSPNDEPTAPPTPHGSMQRGHGDLPPQQGRNNRRVPIILGLAFAAGILLAGGVGVSLFLRDSASTNAMLNEGDTERGSLITAWNAAYTSNKVGGDTETFRDYLPNLDTFRYFNTPTNEGATRTAATLQDLSVTECPAILDEYLQDNP